MIKKYTVEKSKTGKTFELHSVEQDGYLAKVKDEGMAELIAYLLNTQEPDRQSISLSDGTCRKIGQLMEYYSDKGVTEINRADVINASINLVCETIFKPTVVKV